MTTTFNHRLLAHKGDYGDYFMIHEVYYTDGVPDGYTKDGVSVGGESIDEILWVLEKMKACVNEPILWAGDMFPKEYTKK